MPVMQDENMIAQLRKQYPTLTHTSSRSLTCIEPRENVDKYKQPLGEVVFATSDSADFYALRSNDGNNLINFDIPSTDRRIYIFEKMRTESFEHEVSSANFVPIVSGTSKQFTGEWICQDSVEPQKVTRHTPKDILERTDAYVFTISDKPRFEELLKDNSFIFRLKNKETALKTLQKLADQGVLKRENDPTKKQNMAFLKHMNSGGRN